MLRPLHNCALSLAAGIHACLDRSKLFQWHIDIQAELTWHRKTKCLEAYAIHLLEYKFCVRLLQTHPLSYLPANPTNAMSSKINNLILTILDHDAVYDALFSHCTPGTIHHISHMCGSAQCAILDYNARAYDINTHLRCFVTNPDLFRTMQELYWFIVSGSFTLHFMDRTIYPESNMDLYVNEKKAITLAKWIMQEGGRGYMFAPQGDQPEIQRSLEGIYAGK